MDRGPKIRLAGFFADPGKSASLGPGQTSDARARNFVEERIDLNRDELGQGHSFNSPGRNPPPPQPSLDPGRMAESKEMDIQPARNQTARNCTVNYRAMSVDH